MDEEETPGRIVSRRDSVAPRAVDWTAICPKCGKETGQIEEPLRLEVWNGGATNHPYFRDDLQHYLVSSGIADVGFDQPGGGFWKARICMSCKRASVWRDGELIYPAPSPLVAHELMPPGARELFDEASAVSAHSRRAAAALARAAIEVLLKERYDERDLARRVAAAHKDIPEDLYHLLTVLRVVGNEALHDGKITMLTDGGDDDLVPALLGAVNALVEELIARPARARALYASLPDEKRKGADDLLREVKNREQPKLEGV